MKLLNKVIAVTGGGNGIGRELVRGLLDRGAKVAALDRSQAALDETAKILGQPDRLATFALDVSDLAAVQANANDVVQKWGAVDGIINNAVSTSNLLMCPGWGSVDTALPLFLCRGISSNRA
jgi:NAD(P)-dependent dehydrogenase (short-subunit alcohol dehydrogenase family)